MRARVIDAWRKGPGQNNRCTRSPLHPRQLWCSSVEYSKGILPPRALLARLFGALVVAYLDSTGVLSAVQYI